MTDNIHPYQRLQIELAELIEKTVPGDRLPSEPQLAQQMGVSRATLREAMRAFEGQGLIRRRQGIGTFVVGRTSVIESGLEVLQSIESSADSINLKITMGDLHINQVNANSDQMVAVVGYCGCNGAMCCQAEPMYQSNLNPPAGNMAFD